MSALDRVAVSRYLDGDLDYLSLTRAERHEVAREIARREGKTITGRLPKVIGAINHGVVTPPPGGPACVGHDPAIFTSLIAVDEALKTCGTCTVHEWCIETVRPKEGFDGIAGGVVWLNGRRIG